MGDNGMMGFYGIVNKSHHILDDSNTTDETAKDSSDNTVAIVIVIVIAVILVLIVSVVVYYRYKKVTSAAYTKTKADIQMGANTMQSRSMNSEDVTIAGTASANETATA